MKGRSVTFRRACLSALMVGLALAAMGVLIAEASRWGPGPPATWGELQPPRNPSATGEVTGTVYYAGAITGTHTVWIGAFTSTQGGPPLFSVMRSGPGPYTLTGIDEGVYAIMAGMDADDSGGPPNPAVDPLGLYAHNPVTITAGVVISGVDVILLDPSLPPTGTGTIGGLIRYSGVVTASHHIIIFAGRWGGQGPPAYSAVIAGTGPYSITGVAAYTYTVGAFMDLGDDMGPPAPGEPLGWYDPNGDGTPDPVVVNDDDSRTGIDITLYDRRTFLPLILRM